MMDVILIVKLKMRVDPLLFVFFSVNSLQQILKWSIKSMKAIEGDYKIHDSDNQV
jgi:hypothetical protein